MPLEGHFQRVNTPLHRLTSRERNVAVAVIAITVVSFAALLLATAGDSRPGPAPGCIYTVVAGRTGGEPVHGCGAEAEAICAHSARFQDPRAEKVVAACNEANVSTTGTPGGPFSVKRLR
jgi:predicted metal-binding membrane protein